MGYIRDLFPLNYREEKTKFWLDFSYNPQFTYVRQFDQTELTQWGIPKVELYQYSLEMIDNIPPTQPTVDPITETQIVAWIENFNRYHHLETDVTATFSSQIHARCLVADGKIFFKIPITYTAQKFEDLMRHELETHFLRRLNHRQEPWQDEKFTDNEVRRTEEGLAILHTHLFREDQKMYKTYLNYAAVYYAQQHSFAEVFDYLRKMDLSAEKSWLIAVRVKRGLTDTSLPGGLTKDICYLEGAIQVWTWLMDSQNYPPDMYLGRIPLSAIPQLKPISELGQLRYPKFFDNLETYLDNIQQIGKTNRFSELIDYVTNP